MNLEGRKNGRLLTSVLLLLSILNFGKSLQDPRKLNSTEEQHFIQAAKVLNLGLNLPLQLLKKINQVESASSKMPLRNSSKGSENDLNLPKENFPSPLTNPETPGGNYKKYYYIGGGVLIIVVIIIIIVTTCCCYTSTKKKRERKLRKALRENNSRTQKSLAQPKIIESPPMQMKDDSLPRSAPLGLQNNQPRMTFEPQVTKAEVHMRDGHHSKVVLSNICDERHQAETIPHEERISVPVRKSSKDVQNPDPIYIQSDLRTREDNLKRYERRANTDSLERQIQFEQPSSFQNMNLNQQEIDGKFRNQILDSDESQRNKNDRINKMLPEFPQVGPEKQHESRTTGESRKRETEVDIDYKDIKYKMDTIESTMSNIESNLNKLKYLTKDIENDFGQDRKRNNSFTHSKEFEADKTRTNEEEIPQSLHRYSSFQQPNNERVSALKGNEHQWKQLYGSLDRNSLENEYNVLTITDNKYKEPFSRDIRHELGNIIKKSNSLASESNYGVLKRHESTKPSSTIITGKNSKPQDTIYELPMKSLRNEDSLDDNYRQNEKPDPFISCLEEDITIPDPDYLTQRKKEKVTRRPPLDVVVDTRPKIPTKPAVKPREFKGPYGIEDLDDMNNPLTIALRAKTRRLPLDHSDTE